MQSVANFAQYSINLSKNDHGEHVVSAYDVLRAFAVPRSGSSNCSTTLSEICATYDVVLGRAFFKGQHKRSGRELPSCNAEQLLELIMALPGERAGRMRKAASVVFAHWLGISGTKLKGFKQRHGITSSLAVLADVVAGELQVPPKRVKPRGRAGGLGKLERKKRQADLLQAAERARLNSIEDSEVNSDAIQGKRRRICRKQPPSIRIDPIGLNISQDELKRLLLTLGVHLARDNIVLHGAPAPDWKTMQTHVLRVWYLCSIKLEWPPNSTPHWDKWYWFFHVHSPDRETEELWTAVIVPIAVEQRWPVFMLWFAAMLRRFFHSPRTWPHVWAYLQKRVANSKYRPVKDHYEEFLEFYTDATASRKECAVAALEETDSTMKQSKDSAFGPGSHTLIYPGAKTLQESSWHYCVEFERLSLTIQGLFTLTLAHNVCKEEAFPEELLRLYTSSYTEGLRIYYCKHMHTDIKGAIRALERVLGNAWPSFAKTHFNCTSETISSVATRLGNMPPVGPGPQDFFRKKLKAQPPSSEEPTYFRSALLSLDSTLHQIQKSSPLEEAQLLRQAVESSPHKWPCPLDLQAFLCSDHMLSETLEQQIHHLRRKKIQICTSDLPGPREEMIRRGLKVLNEKDLKWELREALGN